MEQVLCKKCGAEIESETNNDLCEECSRKKRKKVIAGVVIGTVVVTAGAVATVMYIKKHPEKIESLKNTFPRIPLLLKEKACSKRLKGVSEVATNVIKTEAPSSYLTAIDQEKIDMALQKGIFNKNMVKRSKFSWEKGFSTVDDLLHSWGANSVIDSYPRWKDHVRELDRTQFEKIVKAAVNRVSGVKDAKICGDLVELSIDSKSGKTSWTAILNFYDEAGNLSPDCQYSGTYYSGNVPRFLINEIRKQMKYIVETQIVNGD